MYIESTTSLLARLRMLALVAPLAVAACDRSTAEIVGEIDAAREGCTEEMLAASAEECVQMFEKYVDMGSEAIGTYIGAMRALDEALQRRPGLQFDTAGLGNAISPGFGTAPDSLSALGGGPEYRSFEDVPASRRPSQPSWRETEPDAADRPGSRSRQAAPPPHFDDRPIDPAHDAPTMRERRSPPMLDESPAERRSAGPAGPARRAPAPRRGALLPPDERLHRPWIGDDEAPAQYTPEDAARSADDPRHFPDPDVEPSREPYHEPPRSPF